MGVGTLRVFNHDTLVPGAVWPMHPHRDIEGITYVVAGVFEHADSAGNGGVLYPGAVQRVTLGSGMMHSEMNHSKTEPMQFIQMWIMPEKRGLPPSIEQKQFTEADRANRLLQLVYPENTAGRQGVIVHRDVGIFASHLEAEHGVEHEFREDRGGYLYVIDGDLDVNAERLAKGDAAKITSAGRLSIFARATSELLLVDTPL
jgi:redox-sensitive bicupin YhaK (pirin superfamily)